MDKLKKIFSAVLGVEEEKITMELSPENTPAWDSLNAIVLITEIEKAFNVRFDYEGAMGIKNFGEVVRFVRSKTPIE